MKVYLFSGIAADGRLFRKIQLPLGFDPVIVDWIKPHKSESISEYAGRLAEVIDPTTPFCLIGVSLGGIMVSEISKIIPAHKTIIIGSVPTHSQLPGYYKWLNKFKIHRLVPGQFYIGAAMIKNYYFTNYSKEDRQMLIQMLKDARPSFVRWGIHAVLNWNNQQKPAGLTHIHGTKDEVFPFKFTAPTHTIKNGGHLLLVEYRNEINRIVGQALQAD